MKNMTEQDYYLLGAMLSEMQDDGMEWDAIHEKLPECTMRDFHIAMHAFGLTHTLDGDTDCEALIFAEKGGIVDEDSNL